MIHQLVSVPCAVVLFALFFRGDVLVSIGPYRQFHSHGSFRIVVGDSLTPYAGFVFSILASVFGEPLDLAVFFYPVRQPFQGIFYDSSGNSSVCMVGNVHLYGGRVNHIFYKAEPSFITPVACRKYCACSGAGFRRILCARGICQCLP